MSETSDAGCSVPQRRRDVQDCRSCVYFTYGMLGAKPFSQLTLHRHSEVEYCTSKRPYKYIALRTKTSSAVPISLR